MNITHSEGVCFEIFMEKKKKNACLIEFFEKE